MYKFISKNDCIKYNILLLVIFSASSALAQSGNESRFQQQAAVDVYENDDEFQLNQAKQQRAEQNFDALISPQNNMPVVDKVSPSMSCPDHQSLAELPLDKYQQVKEQLLDYQEKVSRPLGPAVVLGTAEYSGKAIDGALSLKLKLQVTLGRPQDWKVVPLIGEDVVLVSARVDEKAIPVSRQYGYHVWPTQEAGELTIDLQVLVPARGPRGSIEYDFLVVRTPVTRFSCVFPARGLEPRMDAAVKSSVRPEGNGTRLIADLRPTARVRLVGFKDLGAEDSKKAKVYAESMHLLSIDESSLEMFSVIRYTILYAGTKEFNLLVPKGIKVVSADGKGAFRYTLITTEEGTKILGETAFPIRNNYEISLRLSRETSKQGEVFDVPIPKCVGVEREHGWLGVEVPGKLKLEAGPQIENMQVKDVRQLPEEMIRSSVSPILRAYRYHTPDARVQLVTNRLPELEPESASIDRVRAFTTMTTEGQIMTEMRITLRNRLKHSLSLSLPQGTQIRSATLDGQPVKPSRDSQGRLMLPLKRSVGSTKLQPFTLSVVLKSNTPKMGWLGSPSLTLPSVDLPVSSLSWSVYLPARNIYSILQGDIETQLYAGQVSWYRTNYYPTRGSPAQGALSLGSGISTTKTLASAYSGAMPVRIKLPKDGVRLEYSRYWVDKDKQQELSFWYVRSWLRTPAWMLFVLVFAVGLVVFFGRWPAPGQEALKPGYSALGLIVAIVVVWPLVKVGGLFSLFLGIFAGLLVMASKSLIRQSTRCNQ
jgi:hypothetical protein